MTHDKLLRILPLAGVAYAALQIAGDLTIGPFPDGDSSTSALTRYYADHHSQVALGGTLMSWSVIFLGLFAAALACRARSAPLAAAVIAVGGGAALAHEEFSASTYSLLGSISTNSTLDPAALQAWHITGSEFGIAMGQVVLLLGVAVAAFSGRALPAWAGWTALVLAVLHLTPFGFLGSMLFLLWSAAAGVHLAVRRPRDASAESREPVLQHR
jgi:hypothetical protein